MMKFGGIKAILASVLMVSGLSAAAQGVIVYKTDGTKIDVPYAELDRIATYEDGGTGGGATEGGTIELVGKVGEAVDLGLPSGTLWASWNVGATAPEEYGGYYAWGELAEKAEYTQNSYQYYDKTWAEYKNIGEEISGSEYDVARAMWGDGWSMPTKEQCQELINKCTWEWISYNGSVKGYKVTGPNGNRIFLPAAGYRRGSSLNLAGSNGFCWTGTLYSGRSLNAYELVFSSDSRYVNYYDSNYRYFGQSVRPVREK